VDHLRERHAAHKIVHRAEFGAHGSVDLSEADLLVLRISATEALFRVRVVMHLRSGLGGRFVREHDVVDTVPEFCIESAFWM
jgi:hypothetical protein